MLLEIGELKNMKKLLCLCPGAFCHSEAPGVPQECFNLKQTVCETYSYGNHKAQFFQNNSDINVCS